MNIRVVMLADLDYFYAQCEEVRNPSIKNRPVVVGIYSGRTPDSGAVTTANYVAREYGVRSGMPIFQAKKKLENVESVFLPADFEYYEAISARVMDILNSHADRFEQVGIDEAYLDVTKRTQSDFAEARNLSVITKREIRTIENLTCSIGIGPNKLVAKIAADAQKPDGLTIVRPEELESFLSPLPVSRLLGVGVKTAAKMQSMGIETIGDLARFDSPKLIETYGKKLAHYFKNAARGIDQEPVEQRADIDSISRIATLKKNTRELNEIMDKANLLCESIYTTVIEGGFTFKSIGVTAVLTDMTTVSRSKTLEKATNDLDVLKKSAKELFEKFLEQTELEARRVGVKVFNLLKPETGQKKITSFMTTDKRD